MKGYRTLVLVALTELFSLWQATAPADVIPMRWVPFATGAIGIGFGVLRFLTTTPVGKAQLYDEIVQLPQPTIGGGPS